MTSTLPDNLSKMYVRNGVPFKLADGESSDSYLARTGLTPA